MSGEEDTTSGGGALTGDGGGVGVLLLQPAVSIGQSPGPGHSVTLSYVFLFAINQKPSSLL